LCEIKSSSNCRLLSFGLKKSNNPIGAPPVDARRPDHITTRGRVTFLSRPPAVKKIKPAIHTAMLNRVVDFLAATIVSAAIAAG
jgi:hypothetical protein